MNQINKKSLILVILSVVLILGVFSSCKGNTNDPDELTDSDIFLAEGSQVYFIVPENSDIKAEALENTVFDITGNYPLYKYDSSPDRKSVV